ncbi:hypothetical protein QFZ63_002662 [Streptomyces sp. B3I7]|nr:hypothetical protein [Streptomyces sp. B3I7]
MPPGLRITATRAEYDEERLRRPRLVRALIQVGRIPVYSARGVLAALQNERLDRNERLGTAGWALPHRPAPERIAAADLDLVERYRTPDEQVEAAVALTVLYEPVLLSLRRLAEAGESRWRFCEE